MLSAVTLGAGTALLLSATRWCTRPTLTERLRPYVPGAASAAAPPPASLVDLVTPAAHAVGAAVARALGIGDELATRLERVHDDVDVARFRVRQLGATVAGFAAGAVLALLLRPPSAAGLVLVLGPAALGHLVVEQRLAARAAAWQERVFVELPVVAEQLGMLLSAGYSLGAALARLAHRHTGAIGADLQRVCGRIQQGLSDTDALREWAAIVDVPAVHELVAVLAVERGAGDIGRLIGEEARRARRELQRRQVALLERRAQQVWIPVTVATLVPGAIVLAIPFVEAMRAFAGA